MTITIMTGIATSSVFIGLWGYSMLGISAVQKKLDSAIAETSKINTQTIVNETQIGNIYNTLEDIHEAQEDIKESQDEILQIVQEMNFGPGVHQEALPAVD